jgi:uncharacterized LabA/DUF88 family protein
MSALRTTVYIDAANLILSARTHGVVYSIERLLKYFVYKYSATKCVYFTARIDALSADYALLEKLGVEIVYKQLYHEGGKTKGNCDVEITHKLTLDVAHKNVDNVVLVTGDGDFASLIDYVHASGVCIQLFAISERDTSRLLKAKKFLRIVYLSSVAVAILQGKGPAGHERQEGRLFDTTSIAHSVSASSADKALCELL